MPLAGRPGPSSRGETALRFLRLGFEHILPLGVDHVLFVLGLALLSPRALDARAQVTAFTVAHTATLALSTYGVVRLPSRVVEPLIALSIVYVAVENLVTSGFARGGSRSCSPSASCTDSASRGRSRPGPARGRPALRLLSFNVGVELGQLAVVLPAWGLLALATRSGVPRARIVRPVSVLIGAAGLYWAITRAFG